MIRIDFFYNKSQTFPIVTMEVNIELLEGLWQNLRNTYPALLRVLLWQYMASRTQQTGVHEAPLCTCARNIVSQHKINFCVDVVRMVCFP